ncbi:hypothetical protein IRY61_02155 [Candidatus Saccharibacteria bacterium]|nr:hypothetical protein [Candidatus Saccharibacteria bacterium]
MIISTTIPNLINGISQQPPALRLASQANEQVNGYSSVVDGLRKRPGTRHIKRLPIEIDGPAYLHTINRDGDEKYLVVITQGSIRVFDLEGNEKTVTYPHGNGYLQTMNPLEDFRCVTVADYTFVLNTKIVTQHKPDVTPVRNPECLIWVKQGAYGGKYSVTIDGVTATYTVPDGSQPSHSTQVTTDHICTQLFNILSTNLTGPWSITRNGSLIHVVRTDGQPFSFSSNDSLGDNGIEVIGKRVQRFSSLPARAVDGYVVEITGDQTSSFDNYYVRYDVTDTATNGGVWRETRKGGEVYKLDPSTMPHALIRQADGTFTFEQIDYADREVGDLESTPMPSFVGRRISDVFFHRNRLGFISDENVIFSRAGDFFNFFPATATAVLDDDPIDVGVSHVKVSLLRHAVPFAETLLLFSDQTQFQLGKTDVLTPAKISINQITEYETSLKAKPVGVERHIYFTVNRGKYTSLKEYYVDSDTETLGANEITGHVPQYIPGNVYKIAASGTEDCLCVLTEDARNKVYVYKFYWVDNEKMQSSWSHWEFPEDAQILNADFIESTLYLVIRRPDGIHLEYMDLEPGKTEPNWNIAVHLDQMVNESKVESIALIDGKTHITLPYQLSSTDVDSVQLVTAPGGPRAPGVIADIEEIQQVGTRSVLVLNGDWTDQPFYIGTPYVFRYEFSTLAIREDSPGGGQNVVGEGRLQLRRMTILYDKSGFFRVEVTPRNRDTYKYLFTGRVLGDANNVLGEVALGRGRFSFPLIGHNESLTVALVNDTYLPSYFLSAEWEGFFTIRSRRL